MVASIAKINSLSQGVGYFETGVRSDRTASIADVHHLCPPVPLHPFAHRVVSVQEPAGLLCSA